MANTSAMWQPLAAKEEPYQKAYFFMKNTLEFSRQKNVRRVGKQHTCLSQNSIFRNNPEHSIIFQNTSAKVSPL